MNSLEQNSQVLLGSVKFGQVLSNTEKNGKEPQRVDDFD